MKKIISIVMVLTLLFTLMSFIPSTNGDIAIVPGAEICDNTIEINIEQEGNETFVNFKNNFTLVSFIDDKYTSILDAKEGEITNVQILEPENVVLETEKSEFTIKYSTYEDKTDEIDFFYEYKIHLMNYDGIKFERYIESSGFYKIWTAYFAYIKDFKIIINSNVNLTTDDGDEIKKGIEINYSYVHQYPYYDDYFSYQNNQIHFIKINWSNGGNINRIIELINCNITEEHVADIPNLITQEFVDIEIAKTSNEISYELNGKFILNKSIISWYNPVSLWFPENGSDARANFTYINNVYNYYNSTNRIDCGIEKSVRFGQKGFYIKIPELEEEWSPLVNDPVLNVTIDGVLENNWFDFVIVTIPKEDSIIDIHIPSLFEISKVQSPFEFYEYNNEFRYQNHITFYGKCKDYGKLHIEWYTLLDGDGDLIPDIKDDFPTDPAEWIDTDGDGIGDNSDKDIDGDGWSNEDEQLVGTSPYDPDDVPSDIDGDGTSDIFDLDIDGDSYPNTEDDFPFDPKEWLDTDGDGIGNNADPDDDNDGYNDTVDDLPTNPNEWNDTDGDGIDDSLDEDIDGDNVNNSEDKFPLNPQEWSDSDNDNLGDNKEDPSPNDFDNDGFPDLNDDFSEDPTKWKKDSSKNDVFNLWILALSFGIVIIMIMLISIYFHMKALTKLKRKNGLRRSKKR